MGNTERPRLPHAGKAFPKSASTSHSEHLRANVNVRAGASRPIINAMHQALVTLARSAIQTSEVASRQHKLPSINGGLR